MYGRTWQVQPLFFDLNEVLNLHKCYAANANAVSMQASAVAMVHAAFRIAQAPIAKSHHVPADDLSPKRLLPRLAVASKIVFDAELYFDRVEIAKRQRLEKPSWNDAPKTLISLSDILVPKRNGTGRRRRFSKQRTKWKSLKLTCGSKGLLT